MKRGEALFHLGPELDFLRELWALDHALQKRSKRMSRTIGVTGPQRLALRLVSRFPGLPAGRLATLLLIHPSTLTGIVRRLVKKGWLARRSDKPDRRRAHLQVTPAGIALLEEAGPTIESLVQSGLAPLQPGDISIAIKVIACVTRSLEGKPA